MPALNLLRWCFWVSEWNLSVVSTVKQYPVMHLSQDSSLSNKRKDVLCDIRELKWQRRQRLRKRHLKSEFVLPQSYHAYSISVNSSNDDEFFLELNSKGLYQSSEKKKEVVVLCSRPIQNVKLGSITSYSCNDGKERYKKRDASAKLLFCQSKPVFFAVLVAAVVVA